MATDTKINLVLNKLSKEQFSQAQKSGQINDKELYLVTDDRGAVEGDSRYQLLHAHPVLSSVTIDGVTTNALTCRVEDLAITTIEISSNTYPLYVYMPQQTTAGSRDFCVRIECTSNTAPTVGFFGSGETCNFESTDSEWAKIEPGVNLFNFTETRR